MSNFILDFISNFTSSRHYDSAHETTSTSHTTSEHTHSSDHGYSDGAWGTATNHQAACEVGQMFPTQSVTEDTWGSPHSDWSSCSSDSYSSSSDNSCSSFSSYDPFNS